eukprot:CAMPEP_0178520788 /NCGR_PEP_ID=MMETSP0696-20121128/27598_1 /TAXON_ID=265572 /ORGANISM="Extubocellulus spinifer, Strain CCMP396" /LENGTH=133 /DNA_ID=CAMNT_0020151683 /DNA_START=58 /DNA_END=460 /DNA_ORIENTATION=-
MDAALPALGAALGLAALQLADDNVPDLVGLDWLGFVVPSLAATAAMMFASSGDSDAKSIIGDAAVLTMVGQSVLDMNHAPAAAYAYMTAAAAEEGDMMGALATGAAGAAVLVAVHHVWHNHLKPMIDDKIKSN